MSNIYNNPSSHGLKILASLDEDGLSYEFNTLLIVQDVNSKALYLAHSSGCSCPVPFEEFHYKNGGEDHNLVQITPENFASIKKQLQGFPCLSSSSRIAIKSIEAELKHYRPSVTKSEEFL